MEAENLLEVIDCDGWQKAFPLEQNIVHIGSAPGNDIILEPNRGHGVAPRHLQLILVGNETGQCRLVNLGDTAIQLEGETEATLAPRSTRTARDGQQLRIGEFTVRVHLGGGSCAKTSQAIGLRVALPETRLLPGHPIEGAVIVRNQGDQTGVQFRLALEGLPPACYNLGPPPLLFPNAEKAIPLRITHPQTPELAAGERNLTVRATAPEAYPGEHAQAGETIEVASFFAHTLHLESVDE